MAGVDHTGGGGGGANYYPGNAGKAGGKGLVVVRYPTPSGGGGSLSLSGGTVANGVESGGYKYFAFVADGSLSVSGSGNVDFLVIGGGGGAGAGDPGNNASAGSGAGGVAKGLNVPLSPGSISITVGQGGAGAPAPRSSQASNGGDSKFGSPGEPWYALAHGGGYGSSQISGGSYPGGTGGSGGGGANTLELVQVPQNNQALTPVL